MDKLCGPDSLQVVYHRFSDGVDVVRCVSGFIKEVGEVEQSYSHALEKLVKSHLYNFHSNFLTQLIGSNPYEEIGSVKHSWSKLGSELTTLAKLHAEKAQAYLEDARKPLLDLTPELEEARRELKNKARLLKAELEAAASKHLKEKQKYQQIAEAVEKCWERASTTRSQSLLIANHKLYFKNEEKLASLKSELSLQEAVYHEAYKKHTEMSENFDKEVKELYKTIHAKETERVRTIKKSLEEFAKVLSNTAPVYLESMQRIILCVDQIDSDSDIHSFVDQYPSLISQPGVPLFEKHPISTLNEDKGPVHTVRPMANRGSSDTSPGDFPSSGTDTAAPMSPVEGGGDIVPKPGSGGSSKPMKPPRAQKPFTIKSSTGARRGGAVEGRAHSVSESTNLVNKTEQTPHAGQRKTKKLNNEESKLVPSALVSTVPKLSPVTATPESSATQRKLASDVRHCPQQSHVVQPQQHDHPHTKQHTIGGIEEMRLLLRLEKLAENNDYYRLLGVDPEATAAELAKARREKSRQLHPDHYANDEKSKERAAEQLVVINQIFQDILKNDNSRRLYDQLCAFRKMYPRILEQRKHGLETAVEKLSNLKKALKKVQSPLPLLEELDFSLHLIQIRISKMEAQ